MSAITSRPRVKAVSYTPLSLDLKSLAETRQTMRAVELHALSHPAAGLEPIEVLKASVIEGLNTGAFATKPVVIEQPLRELRAATTATGVEDARRRLVHVLETSHLDALSTAVGEACREASIAAGFETVEVRSAIDGQGLRVIALDHTGRALVSEVNVKDAHVSVETEVIGIGDDTCNAVLDDFDRALEARGVRADTTRAITGGACVLEAAKAVSHAMKTRLVPKPYNRRTNRAPVVARNGQN